MANSFIDLPVPAADGVGAAVDVSVQGKTRTITIQGVFDGANVTVEASVDGGVDFVGVASFTASGKQTIDIAAQFMRVRVLGSGGATACNCDVGSNENGTGVVNLPAPAADGIGAAVDTSALGTFNTVIVTGDFTGQLDVQISEDNVDWTTCFTFFAPGFMSKEVVAEFMRVVRSNSNPLVPGAAGVDVGATNDPTSGAASAGGGSNCLIFRPGSGATGPVVFDTWPALMTKLAEIQADANGSGCYDILLDDSIVSPAVIPAGGPYDLTGVALIGPPDRLSTANVADGASFTGLRTFRGDLTLVNLNTVVSPVADLADGDTLLFDDANVECGPGAVPFFTTPGIGAGQFLFATFENGGQIALGNAVPVIDLAVAGSFFIPVLRIGGIQRGGLSTIAGSATLVQLITDGAIMASPSSLVAVAGSLSLAKSASSPLAQVHGSLAAPLAAPASLVGNDVAYFDVSGGIVAQTLPTIDDATGFNTGAHLVRIIEVSGHPTNSVNVSPAVGETINGAAGAFPVPSGGDITFISDGISDWRVLDMPGDRQRISGALITADPGPNLNFGTIHRLDPSGGAFAVSLPVSAPANRGLQMTFKNDTGSVTAITLTPNAGAGDTIDGAATFVMNLARQSITIVDTGQGNWLII